MSSAHFLALLMFDMRFPRPRGNVGHLHTFAFAARPRRVQVWTSSLRVHDIETVLYRCVSRVGA